MRDVAFLGTTCSGLLIHGVGGEACLKRFLNQDSRCGTGAKILDDCEENSWDLSHFGFAGLCLRESCLVPRVVSLIDACR